MAVAVEVLEVFVLLGIMKILEVEDHPKLLLLLQQLLIQSLLVVVVMVIQEVATEVTEVIQYSVQ